jgi:hypothetical protein
MAYVLMALRKVGAYIATNIKPIEWTDRSASLPDLTKNRILLDSGMALGEYPVPPRKMDRLVGLVVREGCCSFQVAMWFRLCYNNRMDREEIIKELTDPSAIRQQFFNLIREWASFHNAQWEASLVGESPEYAKYFSIMQERFGENLTHQQILLFQLDLVLIFLRLIAENNRRLLSLILTDYPE